MRFFKQEKGGSVKWMMGKIYENKVKILRNVKQEEFRRVKVGDNKKVKNTEKPQTGRIWRSKMYDGEKLVK